MSEQGYRVAGKLRDRLAQRYQVIDGFSARWLVEAGKTWLHTNQETVNNLNVFPVPDGDTGTNMMLTMEAAWKEVLDLKESSSIGNVLQAIAHGALMVGYMSTASTLMIDRAVRQGIDATPVSLGYDRVRFVGPVFINDTITVTYTITSIERERDRTRSKVEVTNQDGETVAVAEHILAWVAKESA